MTFPGDSIQTNTEKNNKYFDDWVLKRYNSNEELDYYLNRNLLNKVYKKNEFIQMYTDRKEELRKRLLQNLSFQPSFQLLITMFYIKSRQYRNKLTLLFLLVFPSLQNNSSKNNMNNKNYVLLLLTIVLVGLVLTLFTVINWITYSVILLIVGILSKRKQLIK